MKINLKSFIISFAFSILMILWEGVTLFNRINKDGKITTGLKQIFFSPKIILLFLFIWLISYFFVYLGTKKIQNIGELLYKYRYGVAVVILVVGVSFELSGSSLGIWGNYLHSNEYQKVLLGVSRQIRSDEWATSIPFIFSQGLHVPSYPYFNDLIRATLTDMFIVSSAPVATIAIIFKPAFIGYIFLGTAKGLSFYWIFRFLLLFLSVFELGMLLTRKNKKLSLMLSMLISFSSVIQWWFVAAGLVEMISMGAIATILIEKYFHLGKDYFKKFLISLALIWCAIVYALTLYPAWQVPVAYIYLAIIVYIIWTNIKKANLSLVKDGGIILYSILSIACILLLLLLHSKEHIQIMANTVYPGRRFEVGGKVSYILSDYPYSIFYSIVNINSERFMNVIYDFFPFSYLFSIYVFWKTKDKLLLPLLIISTMFLIYITVGFPAFLAQITFMYISTGFRVVSIFGLVNLFLLIRSLSVYDNNIKKIVSFAIASAFTLLISVLAFKNNQIFFELVRTNISNSSRLIYALIIVSCFVLFSLIYLILRNDKMKLMYGIAILSFLTGVMVNPIQQGIGVIENSRIVKTISMINRKERGVWLVDNLMFPNINIPLLAGSATINSTSVYPNLNAWHKIDTKKEYEEIYNRFSHVNIQLSNSNQFQASLIAADSVLFSLPVEKLKTLSVNYVLTNRDLAGLTNEKIHFELKKEVDGFKVYALKYNS